MKLTINPSIIGVYAISTDSRWVIRRTARHPERRTRIYGVQKFNGDVGTISFNIEASSILTFCEALLARYPELVYIHLSEQDGEVSHTRVVSRQRELNLGVAA